VNPMSELTALYPPHRRPSGDPRPGCPDPLRLLVCLPPGADWRTSTLLDQLRHRLRAHVAIAVDDLSAQHFPLGRHPNPSQARHLISAVDDAQTGLYVSCAGGPIGLLDLATTEVHQRGRAAQRIAALAATAGRFDADIYGPGLEALQAGTGCFAAYRAGVQVFADGLISLEQRLLTPSFTPLLTEQTLDERQAFHDTARDYLTAAHPATVLVAVPCRQHPAPC